MDSLNVLTENYSLQDDIQNDLPMDIPLGNDGFENNSVLVQNYVIKPLEDGNLELVFCNNEDSQETRYRQQNILAIDPPNFPKQNEINESFEVDLEFDTQMKSHELGVRSVEVPVIRSSRIGDSVIHHAAPLPEMPRVAKATQCTNIPVPILVKPERLLLNVIIYSCFKCHEQFNSLTLFRQHLKWHKAEKNFSCTKCPAGFNAENNLKIHMVTSHPGHHTDVCPICKIKFQRKASLKSHIMMHQVEELFTCDECHGEFQNDDELLKHIEIHAVTRVTKTLSDSLVCPYCKLDFETMAEYKRHIEKHVEVKRNVLKGKKVRKKKPREKPGGYKCKYCSKIFSKSCLLDRHERIHTGERPYVCPYCKRAFAQKGTLQIHLGSHTGDKPYSCTLCSAKFTQKGNLRAHIEKTHTAPKGNQKIYRCTQCPCIFRKVASLNGHITKVHINQEEKESEPENIIDKVMDSLKMLNNELGKSALKRDDPQPAPPAPPKLAGMTSVRLAESHANGGVRRYVVRQKKIGDVRWYFCNFCSSRFKKPSDLIRHFRTHTMEKPYKCTKCNQSFSLKSTLINHSKIHNPPACDCSHCDIRIRNPKKLRRHEAKPGTPSFICVLCEEVFFTLEEGRKHREVHESEILGTQNIIEPILKQPLYETTYGSLPLKPPKSKIPNTGTESPLDRPHHCKVCEARFTRLMSLKRHMKFHAGERNFKCSLCPKAFITKYRLQEHMNYHKNIRKYACQTCGKKFVTASILKRHTIVHNNFKPYLCPYCDKHFKTVLLCRAHIQTVHKLEWVNDEELQESTEKIESGADRPSENISLASIPVVRDKVAKENESSSNFQREIAPPTESSIPNTHHNSVILSVASQENQQDSNPGYQMVYLNIGDLPANNADGLLNGNNMLSTVKIQSDSLLFNPLNDLQDSAVLFNMDTNKSNMVDPNEVIKSTTIPNYTPSVISKTSPNTSNLGSFRYMATRRSDDLSRRGNDDSDLGKGQALPNLQSYSDVGDVAAGQQGISLQDFSTVDLGELPISIIGTDDSATMSSNLLNGELNINPNDMFYDAQVICVNCHKMFSDMNVFQRHVCSQNPDTDVSENVNLLMEEDGVQYSDGHMVEKVYNSNQNLPTRNESVIFKSTNIPMQEATNQIEPYDFSAHDEHLIENDQIYLNKLKRFKNKKPLLRDVDKLEKSRGFQCRHCNFFTTIEERYRKHMTYVHVQSMDKVCKFCFKDFKKLSDLVRHVRTHTGERPFECEKCHKKFSLKSTLESHLRTHEINSVTKISCDVCNSNFTTKSSLKVHMLLHTGARPHACTFCDQTFRTSAIRKAHEKNMHLSKSKQGLPNKPKSARRLLKSVAESVADDFSNEKERTMDNAKEPEASVIQSTSDAIILNTAQDSVTIDPVFLLQHLQNSGLILTADHDGTVPLNLSDITLLDYESLKTNGNYNNDNYIGDVENLQYKRSDPNQLEYNERIDNLQFVPSAVPAFENDNEKAVPVLKQQKVVQKVECDICHKLYASKDVLRKHKKNVHGQNKKFPCIKCDKGYDSLEELNKHIVKLHTGHRPYACQYCANSFSEENSLKTHIKRIHQKSLITQETTNALLGLQFDLPTVPSHNSLM